MDIQHFNLKNAYYSEPLHHKGIPNDVSHNFVQFLSLIFINLKSSEGNIHIIPTHLSWSSGIGLA